MFEHLVSVHIGWFMECRGVLPIIQFAYRTGLCICIALLCVSRILQSVWARAGDEDCLDRIQCSFGKVTHQRSLLTLLYGLLSIVLSVLIEFLSNRSQYVVGGCRSTLMNVVSGVP